MIVIRLLSKTIAILAEFGYARSEAPKRSGTERGNAMKMAAVIGSGITGPMAAIVLRMAGYEVSVFEARPEADLHSDGILGITNENWLSMQAAHVKLARYQLINDYTDGNTGHTTKSPYQYITWTDLHNALTERASELGVRFNYLTEVKAAPPKAIYDVTIWASGVGDARKVSVPTYSGYVVLRGLAYQYSGTAWTSLKGDTPDGPIHFVVGDTRDGASVALFAPRNDVQMRTTYSAVAPKEILALPIRWRRLLETVPLWQQAPVSDWSIPERMVTDDDSNGHVSVRIGDANGQLRPATSMGANLGLNEAMTLRSLIAPDPEYIEDSLLQARYRQFQLGIRAGI